MLKYTSVSFLLLFAVTATAQDTNLYDLYLTECLGTTDDLVACHGRAKNRLLADVRMASDYLECVDYEHSPLTLTQEADCLREVSGAVN